MARVMLPSSLPAVTKDAAIPIEQHLGDLRNAQVRLLTLQGDIDRLVAQLRMEGATWAQVGAAVGTTAQAAHQRWSIDGREKHRARQQRLSNKTESGTSGND